MSSVLEVMEMFMAGCDDSFMGGYLSPKSSSCRQ